jgi:hypothetical protein
MGFSRSESLVQKQLGIAFKPKDRKEYAFVSAYGVKGPSPTKPPKRASRTVGDYTISREDLAYYTTSSDYKLSFWEKREFASWPLSVQFRIDAQALKAEKSQPFDNDYAFYETTNVPPESKGALSIKETDLKWVVLKPTKQLDEMPLLEIKPSFAFLKCVSDGRWHWAGTVIAFTPNMLPAQLTIGKISVTVKGDDLQIVQVDDR